MATNPTKKVRKLASKLKVILAELDDEHNIRRSGRDLVHAPGESERHLIKSFRVMGMACSTSGRVLGALIATSPGVPRSRCIVPLAAIREPSHLAPYLEELGLIPPSDRQDLKLVAMYIDRLARRKTLTVVAEEGIHLMESVAGPCYILVNGSEVIGGDGCAISVIDRKSSYSRLGTPEGWKAAMGPLIKGNPLMIVTICFGLAAPLGALLNFRPMGLLVAGPSSTGKTTLAKLLMSLFCEPGEPHQWAGTANGIEALAAKFRDLPLILDELGTGEAGRVPELLYRISGGVTKARATVSGSLQQTDAIRSPIFATGEVSLRQHANVGGGKARAGHDVRMPTVWVDEAHGVYTEIGAAANGAAFAELVTNTMREHYGCVLPEFIQEVIADREATVAKATALRTKIEPKVAGDDAAALSGVERRVLNGFVNYAVAGELATRLKVLPLDRGDPTKAAAHVFGQWLRRWRQELHEPTQAPLRHLREFLKREGERLFVPLTEWRERPSAGLAGFKKSSAKHGELFLVFPGYFEDALCKKHGLEATMQALRDAELLATGAKGRTMLVRMPGKRDDEEPKRMTFYAIPTRIMFESD